MNAVYLVDGLRTPFLKARTQPGPFSAADLAVSVCRPLLLRQPFPLSAIDEVICGCTMPSPDEANIARLIALRTGCPEHIPAWTVQRNCASGLQAIDSAMNDIRTGRHHLILAGGVDVMSRAPLLYPLSAAAWFGQWMGAKSILERLKLLTQWRPQFLIPVIALLKGLTDPLVGLTMGQTAEVLAHQFQISRQEMDEFALESHRRAYAAPLEDEIYPGYATQGTFYLKDDGIRSVSELQKLKQLKPFFDKKWGSVTAGNSSQITDGAAFVILASQEMVDRYQLPVMAKLVDVAWSGLAPEVMGLGPVYAMSQLMQHYHLRSRDIDVWEINEAFAGQVLACLKAWSDETFCRQYLKCSQPYDPIAMDQLNIDGGAISIGHPVGASGARLVLHVAHVLKRQRKQRGIASLCIGGGQGGAILIEGIS